jgi:hypothetical protein
MGIDGNRGFVAIAALLAILCVRETVALPPPASASVECDRAAGSIDGIPGTRPSDPTSSRPLSTGDLTKFIDESFKDPSLVYCQPFLGCEARAHVLARRLTEQGAKVRKIFAEGRLLALARDGKYYAWQGHVATVVEVTDNVDGHSRTREMVIDPSLFDHPVTEAEWKSAILIGDSSADFSYGAPTRYDPPSNIFIHSDANYYTNVAKETLRAISQLNVLPPEAQKDFQKRMRNDQRLNRAWRAEGFLQRWGDPVFREAWIKYEIKPAPGQDDYDDAYWRNWQPPH